MKVEPLGRPDDIHNQKKISDSWLKEKSPKNRTALEAMSSGTWRHKTTLERERILSGLSAKLKLNSGEKRKLGINRQKNDDNSAPKKNSFKVQSLMKSEKFDRLHPSVSKEFMQGQKARFKQGLNNGEEMHDRASVSRRAKALLKSIKKDIPFLLNDEDVLRKYNHNDNGGTLEKGNKAGHLLSGLPQGNGGDTESAEQELLKRVVYSDVCTIFTSEEHSKLLTILSKADVGVAKATFRMLEQFLIGRKASAATQRRSETPGQQVEKVFQLLQSLKQNAKYQKVPAGGRGRSEPQDFIKKLGLYRELLSGVGDSYGDSERKGSISLANSRIERHMFEMFKKSLKNDVPKNLLKISIFRKALENEFAKCDTDAAELNSSVRAFRVLRERLVGGEYNRERAFFTCFIKDTGGSSQNYLGVWREKGGPELPKGCDDKDLELALVFFREHLLACSDFGVPAVIEQLLCVSERCSDDEKAYDFFKRLLSFMPNSDKYEASNSQELKREASLLHAEFRRLSSDHSDSNLYTFYEAATEARDALSETFFAARANRLETIGVGVELADIEGESEVL